LIGVFDDAPTVNVTSNTIAAPGYGLFLLAAGGVSGNHISGANVGVAVGAGGATITGNRIVSSTTSGIELGCLTGTVSGNFINDAPVGIDQAPAGIGPNSFANTATTMTNGCAVAAVARQASGAMATHANLLEQWHTPATPFGTRTK
jgi:hypothetical protein